MGHHCTPVCQIQDGFLKVLWTSLQLFTKQISIDAEFLVQVSVSSWTEQSSRALSSIPEWSWLRPPRPAELLLLHLSSEIEFEEWSEECSSATSAFQGSTQKAFSWDINIICLNLLHYMYNWRKQIQSRDPAWSSVFVLKLWPLVLFTWFYWSNSRPHIRDVGGNRFPVSFMWGPPQDSLGSVIPLLCLTGFNILLLSVICKPLYFFIFLT